MNQSQWACATHQMNEQGLPSGPLLGPVTVGEKFFLICEGQPIAVSLGKPLHLKIPKEQKYGLHVLETRSMSESRAEWVVTTYLTGPMNFENPVMTDGEVEIALGPVKFQSASVLNPQTNPEPQPFGPWGPVLLAWPAYVWVLFGLLTFVFCIALGLLLRRIMRRRRLLLELKKNATALSPYQQFNKELRQLNRRLPMGPTRNRSGIDSSVIAGILADLRLSFRWFLARELVIPAIDGTPATILRELRRSDKDLYKQIKKELSLALVEIERAVSVGEKISVTDISQIIELCRGLADQMVKKRVA